MSTKYKFIDKQGVYFTTSKVVGWADVFTRDVYRNILLDSIRFCQKNQGLSVHAWVLMTNHLHMICSFHAKQEPGLVLKNMKSFTAIKLIDAIINNPKESKKEYMLNLFEAEGKKSSSNQRFKFCSRKQSDGKNHPVLLDSDLLFSQKLNYLHWNPITAGFVAEPWHWIYSSATDYFTEKKRAAGCYYFGWFLGS
jgi:REP element-mobilizing transposase RayT